MINLSKIFEKTAKKRMLFFIVMDILLISLAIWLAFLLRFDGKIPGQYLGGVFPVIIISVLVPSILFFYLFRLYSFSWSYVSANELVSLVKAVALSFLSLAFLLFIFKDLEIIRGFPRSVLFISYFLIFIFCGAIRLAKRIYMHLFKRENGREKTLIVGAGDAGEQILRSIQFLKTNFYSPVGFVDDNSMKQGIIIHGLEVLGKIDEIPKIVKEHNVQQMIIALPSAGSRIIKKAVELGRNAGLKKIKIVPSISEIVDGEISIRDLREVRVEDLLGREPVDLDKQTIEDFVKDKVILITGAAGSIGSELSQQTAKFRPSRLLLLDQDETGLFYISKELKNKFFYLKITPLIADITDKEKINYVFGKFRPNIVFHAAAYKHVPLMERNPDQAIKNNVFGTEIVGKAALKQGVEKFIFISTDKAINPTSVMGATKRMGEMLCQKLNQQNQTRFISVRFGNVLGSRGSVIPVFKEQIRKGGPVGVTHFEMKRYFMITSEAVLLVMQAGAIGRGGEVFVLDMGKPINILDLAKEMIRLSGFEPDKDIPIVFTGPRPGEKFFEEILTAEEGTIATQNQNIFTAKLSNVDGEKLEQALARLKEIVNTNNQEEIKNVLKEFVTFYRPHK